MGFSNAEALPYSDKMLWLGVLRRAVFDYVLYNGVRSHRIEWQKAYRYVFQEGIRYENGLSFEEVCGLFGWEPSYLRRLTLKLERSDIKKIEYGAYREALTFQDFLALAADAREKWNVTKAALPLFAPYNYPEDVREKLKLKACPRSYLGSIPRVKWDSAAA